MKKLMFLMASIIILSLSLAVSASAAVSEEGFYYEVENDQITITGHNNPPVVMTVPEKIDGKVVVTIDSSAFENEMGIGKVILPESVTTIGDSAFSRCENLYDFNGPGVTVVDGYAFYNCSSLNSVVLGETPKSVGYMAFESTPMKAKDIEDGVCYLDSIALADYTNDIGATVTLREGTKCIATSCFNSNQMITIKLPQSLRNISNSAFAYAPNLQSIEIPDTVEWIADRAFSCCSKLTTFKVSENTAFSGNPLDVCYNVTVYSTVGSQWHQLAVDYMLNFDTLDNNPGILQVMAKDNLNKISVEANLKNADKATVFAIGYDEDGNRVGVKKFNNNVATFPTGEVDWVEVFCWESFKTLRPWCKSVKATVIEKAEFESVEVSQTPESQNHGGNISDGNLSTAWACKGNGTIIIDLGKSKDIEYVDVYLKEYNDNRTLPLRVQYSKNGSTWYAGFWGNVTKADGYKNTTILRGEESARYIKITVDGSSIGDWCSVTEVEVYCEK